MKITSILLSLMLVNVLTCHVNSLACNRLREIVEEDYGDTNCRFRLGASLRGGVGCTAKCEYTDEPACYLLNNGERVCGRAYFKVSEYISRRVEFEYGVLPGNGLIEGRFGRYSFMFRQCEPLNRFCGCQIVAAGSPCFCAIIPVILVIRTRCPIPWLDDLLPEEGVSPADSARFFLRANSNLVTLFDRFYSLFEDA
jgi:hypothetical protein